MPCGVGTSASRLKYGSTPVAHSIARRAATLWEPGSSELNGCSEPATGAAIIAAAINTSDAAASVRHGLRAPMFVRTAPIRLPDISNPSSPPLLALPNHRRILRMSRYEPALDNHA